uniref:Uncharacterized protein n=1 Tax=Caenorhabditis japonica TaxID=281687 RepID=A0A8R1IZ46_CAEJA
MTSGSQVHRQQQSSHPSKDSSHRPTARPPGTPCVFCATLDSFHRHVECPKYPNAKDRFQRAHEKTGHNGSTCERKRPCHHCRGGHHTSLCRNNNKSNDRRHEQRQSRNDSQSRNNSQSRGQSPANRSSNRSSSRRYSPAPNTGYSNNWSNSRANSPGPVRQDRRVQFGGPPAITHAATTTVGQSIYVPMVLSSAPLQQDTNVILHSSNNQIVEADQLPHSSDRVSIMAGKIIVEDIAGNLHEITIPFDTGSDRSYMSQDLFNILKL